MGKPSPSPGPQVQPGGAGEQCSGQPVSLSPEFTSGDGGRYAEKIPQPAGVAQLTSGQGCTAVCVPGLQQGHACSEAQVCPHPACLCVAQQLQTHAHDTQHRQTLPWPQGQRCRQDVHCPPRPVRNTDPGPAGTRTAQTQAHMISSQGGLPSARAQSRCCWMERLMQEVRGCGKSAALPQMLLQKQPGPQECTCSWSDRRSCCAGTCPRLWVP